MTETTLEQYVQEQIAEYVNERMKIGPHFGLLTNTEQQRCVHMLDSSSRSDIEIFCRGGLTQTEASGIVLWIDISHTPECPVEKQIVQDAIWWCERRGLFTRHPEHAHMVRFKTPAREQYEQRDVPITRTENIYQNHTPIVDELTLPPGATDQGGAA